MRITSGSLVNPIAFNVFHPDGRIWRYGSRDDESARSSNATLKGSTITLSAATLDPTNGVPNSDRVSENLTSSRSMAWYVDEVVDRWGNFMEIDYDRTTNSAPPGAVEVVPHWIRWTGHHGAPVLQPSRLVEFQYQPGETQTLYRGGIALRTSRILSLIVVSGPDRLVSDTGTPGGSPKTFRQYRLTYKSHPTGLAPDPLNTITEEVVNPDGSVVQKDPISFDWSNHPVPNFQSPNVLNDVIEFPLPTSPYDLIEASIPGFTESETAASAEVSEANVWYSVVGDFNGDGRDDLLYRLPRYVPGTGAPARAGPTVGDPLAPVIGDWYIRLGSPTGLGPRQKVTGIPASPGGDWIYSARAIDIDADGKAELIAYHESTDLGAFNEFGYTLYRFADCSAGTCSFTPESIGEESVTALTTGFARRGIGLDMGDLNSDGLLDIVQNPLTCQNPNPTLCPPPVPVSAFSNLIARPSVTTLLPSQFGDATIVTSSGANVKINTSEPRYIVDIDGNGVPEILTTTYNSIPAQGPPNFTAAFLSSLSLPTTGGEARAAPLLLHSRPLEQSAVIQPPPSCIPFCQAPDQCFNSTSGSRIYLTPFTRYFVDLNCDGLPDSVSVPSDNEDSCQFPTSHGSEVYISMNAGGVFRAPFRVQQTTHDGFNTSLDRDDYRDPIGPPQDPGGGTDVSIPGRAVDPGARFVDLDGDGRTDIIQLSRHDPEPADNATRGDKSLRDHVVWIRSVEGGFLPGVDLKAGPDHTPIPAAPQRYVRNVVCDTSNVIHANSLCNPSNTEHSAANYLIAGGYGARLSQIGDFNGDGALDIVTLVQYTDTDTWARLQQFLGQPVAPDVVTAIDGGPLKPAIHVNYQFAGPQSTDGFYSVSAGFDAHGDPLVCNPSPCDFGQTYLRKLGWVVHDYSVEAGQFAGAQYITFIPSHTIRVE